MGCNFHSEGGRELKSCALRSWHPTLPAPDAHPVIIERLLPNMLDSTGENVFFGEYFIEAPMLFKRESTYYALFDRALPCHAWQRERGGGVSTPS